MRSAKSALILIVVLCNLLSLSGCWNYKEIDKMAIVSGLSIDVNPDNSYLLTIEIVDVKGGIETKLVSNIVTSSGVTLFDAIRNAISVIGRRIYWSHCKILILSNKIQEKELIKIIDWFSRDSETRDDISVLVSKEPNAKDIFSCKPLSNDIISFAVDEMLKSETSLSKTPHMLISDLIMNILQKEKFLVLPTIELANINDKPTQKIIGAAFYNGNTINYLDGDDAKTLLFIRNKIKGGLLIQKDLDSNDLLSLEIFKSKTDVKPKLINNQVVIFLNVKSDVAIDEFKGVKNDITSSYISKLKSVVETRLNSRILALIKKFQNEYQCDIFEFSSRIYDVLPSEWAKIKSNWNDYFKNIKVYVSSEINIRNSASMSKTI